MSTIEKFLNEEWDNEDSWKHIHEFADRLEDVESECKHDHSISISILESMGYEKNEIDELLEWFENNGGYCDCEVYLNVVMRYYQQ